MSKEATAISGRGTGETTRQIKEAPKGAVFVWCNEFTWLAREMTHRLGRDDLTVVGPAYYRSARMKGLNKPVVIDHAARV